MPSRFALWAFLCAAAFLQGCAHTPATLTLFEALGVGKSVAKLLACGWPQQSGANGVGLL
jgi:hypothetical protein